MKLKLALLFTLVTFANISLKAQDSKFSQEHFKQQEAQIKSRYEQQMKADEQAFKRDMENLKMQKNLSPAKRKARERALRERYEQQKRDGRKNYEKELKSFEEQRKYMKGGN
jgi:hypothetical protein